MKSLKIAVAGTGYVGYSERGLVDIIFSYWCSRSSNHRCRFKKNKWVFRTLLHYSTILHTKQ